MDIAKAKRVYREYRVMEKQVTSRAMEIWKLLGGRHLNNFDFFEFIESSDRVMLYYSAVDMNGDDIYRHFIFPCEWLNLDNDSVKREYEADKSLVFGNLKM